MNLKPPTVGQKIGDRTKIGDRALDLRPSLHHSDTQYRSSNYLAGSSCNPAFFQASYPPSSALAR